MSRKRLIWMVALAFVLAASGGGYYYYQNVYLQAQAPAEEATLATSQVQRGDLVITADGSGTLQPGTEISIGFRSSGMLAEVLVKVGDKVEAGQLLARLDKTDAQMQVTQAEINLHLAELELADLTQEADPADLASAQASLASAKAELTALTSPPGDQELLAARQSLKSAQDALQDLLDGPDPDEVEIAKADLTLAEMNLRIAQSAYDRVANEPNVAMTQEAMDLWEATTNYDQARAAYREALEGATADEIADARAQVALAQAELDALQDDPDPDELAAAQAKVVQAQAELDSVLTGAASKELEAAQLNVQQAQLELESARATLAETELLAPAAGTVTAVEAEPGETVGTESFITLADLDQPLLLFWVEESDLLSVAPGNPVNVTFEALPDYIYPGEILSVDPALVDVDGTAAVQAYASLDLSAHPIALLSGMNATLEIVAGEARDALLVPIEALRELAAGQYAVFVVQKDGELELRPVAVGLKDYVNAEIVSGLEAGEIVRLGTEQPTGTLGTSDQGTGSQQGGMPAGGMMPFLGGQP